MNKYQAALFHARRIIDNADGHFICCALDTVALQHPNLADQARWLQAHIARNLYTTSGNRCGSLAGWLRCEVGIGVVQQHTVRLARLAWIDKMMEDHK